MKKRIPLLILLLLSLIWSLSAQEVVASSGGEATGQSGVSSYTIGQVVYSMSSSAEGSVTPSVHQFYSVTPLFTPSKIDLSLDVYPNPTADRLTLELPNNDFFGLTYSLYDLQGVLLETWELKTNQSIIDMTSRPSGMYLIHVTNEQGLVKSFKIIKSKL